jgi:hypothetical protein
VLTSRGDETNKGNLRIRKVFGKKNIIKQEPKKEEKTNIIEN